MPPRKNVAPSNAVRQFWCDICSKGYPRQPDFENHLRSYDHNHRQRLADLKKITARNDGDREKKRGPGDMRSMPVEGSNKKSTGSGPRFTKIGGAPSGFKKVGVAVQTSESASEEKAVETTQKVASAAEKKAQEEQDQLVQLLKQQEEVQKKIAQLKAEKEAKAKADAQAQAQAQAKASEVPIVQTPPPAEKALSDDPTRIEVEDITMGGTEDTVFAVQTYHEEPKMDVDDGEDEEDDEESITWERYDFTKPTDCDHKTCLGCKTDGIWDDNLLAT